MYRQVPDCDPPRYKFLWGPWAYVETSKLKVLDYLDSQLKGSQLLSAPLQRLRGKRKGDSEPEQQPDSFQVHVQQLVLRAGREADPSLCD